MKLSKKQKLEIDRIHKYTKNINGAIKYPDNYHLIMQNYAEELETFKIKLEIFFSDTDCKKEQADVLWTLIDIEQILSNGSSDDFERYVNMGLQIAPHMPIFHCRIEN